MKLTSIIIYLFITIIILSACDNSIDNIDASEGHKVLDANKHEEVISESKSIDENFVIDDSSELITKVQKNSLKFMVDVPQLYKEFLAKMDMGENESVVYFKNVDLDLDGTEEAIVAFGYSSEDLTMILVLMNKDGEIIQLGKNQNSGGYSVNEIKLIELENRAEKVIFFGLTNGANLRGFKIVALSGQNPEEIVYSASATGEGYDELIDSNQNAKYDGYVQYRSSYDVLYYSVSRTFTLEQGEFKLSNTTVDLKDYPSKPEEVIKEYLTLWMLSSENSDEVYQRLTELCQLCSEHSKKVLSDSWYDEVDHSIWLSEDNMKFDIYEEEHEAEVVFSLMGEDKKVNKLNFHLIKINNNWTIEEIKSHENNGLSISSSGD